MEDSKKLKVRNRSHSSVVYVVPDMNNLRREFSGLEEKIITFEELRKLNGLYGGRRLLENDLVIKDKEALEELNLHVEPEYFYGKEEVDKLLREGSMDQFLDCLDFAPDGVIDLIKSEAVALPLNDVSKREVLLNKLGYDVNKIIEIQKLSSDEDEEKKQNQVSRRRVVVPSEEKPASSGRRVVIKTDE